MGSVGVAGGHHWRLVAWTGNATNALCAGRSVHLASEVSALLGRQWTAQSLHRGIRIRSHFAVTDRGFRLFDGKALSAVQELISRNRFTADKVPNTTRVSVS